MFKTKMYNILLFKDLERDLEINLHLIFNMLFPIIEK